MNNILIPHAKLTTKITKHLKYSTCIIFVDSKYYACRINKDVDFKDINSGDNIIIGGILRNSKGIAMDRNITVDYIDII